MRDPITSMDLVRLHKTVGVRVGRLQVGGGAPVVVQSMTMTDTADAQATEFATLLIPEMDECLGRRRVETGVVSSRVRR